MLLEVLTPDKQIFQGSVSTVNLPGVNGRFEILENHAPIVAALGEGVVRYKDTSGEEHAHNIKRGFIEVLNNKIALLVQGLS